MILWTFVGTFNFFADVETFIDTAADGIPLATTTSVLAPSSIPAGTEKFVDEDAPDAIDLEL